MSKDASIRALIDQLLGDDLVIAEIGVFEGSTSFGLLKSPKIKHLYMIDPWQSGYSVQDGSKTDSSDKDQEWMDATYNKVVKKAKQYPNRTTIIRKPSVEAAKEVPDNLDLVFIDGNHSFEAVYDDLSIWVPKVRHSGIVCGDDWSTGWKSVSSAVTKYISKHHPFLPPFRTPIVKGDPVPYYAPIINRTWQTVWWGIKTKN